MTADEPDVREAVGSSIEHPTRYMALGRVLDSSSRCSQPSIARVDNVDPLPSFGPISAYQAGSVRRGGATEPTCRQGNTVTVPRQSLRLLSPLPLVGNSAETPIRVCFDAGLGWREGHPFLSFFSFSPPCVSFLRSNASLFLSSLSSSSASVHPPATTRLCAERGLID